jgi:lysophospholipase L1-like esterase
VTENREIPRARLLAFWAVLGLLLTGAVVALVVVLEFGFSHVATRPVDHLAKHPRLHHTWRPNGTQEHKEWIEENPSYPEPYTHRYNAQGWLESYDVIPQKPVGTYRIFYVGDSFTEGTVPMSQSVPSLVETYLNSLEPPEPLRFEVINTGTSSYSPILYYILVRYFLIHFAPDLIVVNVDMTDVFDDAKYDATLTLDELGDPWGVAPSDAWGAQLLDIGAGVVEPHFLDRLRRYLHEKSYTYNFLLERVRRSAAGPPEATGAAREPGIRSQRWGWVQMEWDERTAEEVESTLRTLGALADFCSNHDIRLLLTGVPHYRQFPKDASGKTEWSLRPHKEIERVASERGVQYLDSQAFLAPLIAGSEQTAFYYKRDMHFNPSGYGAWARAHIEALGDPARGLQEAYLP